MSPLGRYFLSLPLYVSLCWAHIYSGNLNKEVCNFQNEYPILKVSVQPRISDSTKSTVDTYRERDTATVPEEATMQAAWALTACVLSYDIL